MRKPEAIRTPGGDVVTLSRSRSPYRTAGPYQPSNDREALVWCRERWVRVEFSGAGEDVEASFFSRASTQGPALRVAYATGETFLMAVCGLIRVMHANPVLRGVLLTKEVRPCTIDSEGRST